MIIIIASLFNRGYLKTALLLNAMNLEMAKIRARCSLASVGVGVGGQFHIQYLTRFQ